MGGGPRPPHLPAGTAWRANVLAARPHRVVRAASRGRQRHFEGGPRARLCGPRARPRLLEGRPRGEARAGGEARASSARGEARTPSVLLLTTARGRTARGGARAQRAPAADRAASGRRGRGAGSGGGDRDRPPTSAGVTPTAFPTATPTLNRGAWTPGPRPRVRDAAQRGGPRPRVRVAAQRGVAVKNKKKYITPR